MRLSIFFVLSLSLSANADECRPGTVIAQLLNQSGCHQHAGPMACAMAVLGVAKIGRQIPVQTMVSEDLIDKVGGDRRAARFLAEVRNVVETHARDHARYIDSLGKPETVKQQLERPNLDDRFRKLERQYSGMLNRSPLFQEVIKLSRTHIAIEMMVIHKTEVAKQRKQIETRARNLTAEARAQKLAEFDKYVARLETSEGMRREQFKKLEAELKAKADQTRVRRNSVRAGAAGVAAVALTGAGSALANAAKLNACAPKLTAEDQKGLLGLVRFEQGVSGSCEALHLDEEQLLELTNRISENQYDPSPEACQMLETIAHHRASRKPNVNFQKPPQCDGGPVDLDVGGQKISYQIKTNAAGVKTIESTFVRASSHPHNSFQFELKGDSLAKPNVTTARWHDALEGAAGWSHSQLIQNYLNSCAQMKEVIESDLQPGAILNQQKCAVGRVAYAVEQSYPAVQFLCATRALDSGSQSTTDAPSESRSAQ